MLDAVQMPSPDVVFVHIQNDLCRMPIQAITQLAHSNAGDCENMVGSSRALWVLSEDNVSGGGVAKNDNKTSFHEMQYNILL